MADHIFLNFEPESINYTSPRRGSSSPRPPRDRMEHAEKLKLDLENIWKRVEEDKDNRLAIHKPVKDGTYLEFIGEPGYALTIKSLENKREGIKLLNVKKYATEGDAEAETENKDNEPELFIENF